MSPRSHWAPQPREGMGRGCLTWCTCAAGCTVGPRQEKPRWEIPFYSHVLDRGAQNPGSPALWAAPKLRRWCHPSCGKLRLSFSAVSLPGSGDSPAVSSPRSAALPSPARCLPARGCPAGSVPPGEPDGGSGIGSAAPRSSSARPLSGLPKIAPAITAPSHPAREKEN